MGLSTAVNVPLKMDDSEEGDVPCGIHVLGMLDFPVKIVLGLEKLPTVGKAVSFLWKEFFELIIITVSKLSRAGRPSLCMRSNDAKWKLVNKEPILTLVAIMCSLFTMNNVLLVRNELLSLWLEFF